MTPKRDSDPLPGGEGTLRQLREGDPAALETTARWLERIARRACGSNGFDPENIAAESMHRILTHLKANRPIGHEGFLRTVVQNLVADAAREQGRGSHPIPLRSTSSEAPERIAEQARRTAELRRIANLSSEQLLGPELDQRLDRARAIVRAVDLDDGSMTAGARRIVAGLRATSPKQRTAIVLKLHGIPPRDMGPILGCEYGTVRSHLSRGILRFRQRVGEWDGSNPLDEILDELESWGRSEQA